MTYIRTTRLENENEEVKAEADRRAIPIQTLGKRARNISFREPLERGQSPPRQHQGAIPSALKRTESEEKAEQAEQAEHPWAWYMDLMGQADQDDDDLYPYGHVLGATGEDDLYGDGGYGYGDEYDEPQEPEAYSYEEWLGNQ